MDGLPQQVAGARDADCERWSHSAEAWREPRGAAGRDAAQAGVESAERRAQLASAVEAELIPRLMRAHRHACVAGPGAATPVDAADAAAIASFTASILADDVPAATLQVERMRAAGASLEALCMDLLAPVARRLGELWAADCCDFARVTAGLWHLQQLLRQAGPGFPSSADCPPKGLCALLVATPGDLHTFGLAIAIEFFRRGGWNVHGAPQRSVAELGATVRSGWYDVAGLAVSTEGRLDALRAGIREIRRCSRNRAIVVIVGGPLFAQRPELVAVVGADAQVVDARTAPRLVEQRLAGAEVRRR